MEHQESSSLMKQCRICHDEEDQSCSTMEPPCSCSGSLKVSIHLPSVTGHIDGFHGFHRFVKLL
jgi:hypothetical protein